jgi:hypothetical protein
MTHTKDEALELALDALETLVNGNGFAPAGNIEKARKAITAIKQALAAPVQEPEIVQRVKRYAGQTMRTARNPNITARECIELANWIAGGQPAAPDLQAELDATNRQVEILSDALAESRREVGALKAVQPVACECNQGQVCHICDPIIPSKQLAQQEPAFWYYTLVVEGQVVGENFTTVNWDTRVEPFGRYDIDHGGKVTKQPLYTTPPAQEFRCSTGLCHYKALPDAIHHTDLSEHPEYISGWNDYRKAMMEMMK